MRAKNVIDYATLTVSSTAIGLSSASPAITAAVKEAVITVETANLRYRSDGTDPTTTEGNLVYQGDVINFLGADYSKELNAIKFIRDDSTDVKLKITYYD